MAAALAGNTGVVRVLIDARADVNAQNRNGHTALMIAAVRGDAEMVEVLIRAGANVNGKNKKGKTASMTGLWPVINPGRGFRYHDYYPWISGRWIVMELATVAVALVALRRVHFPFLVAPIAFSLWFFSMDIAEIILRRGIDWEGRAWVSIGVGAVILAAAYLTDRVDRHREDFAFWLYLFGLMAFWGGLSSLPGRTEWSRFLYFLINLGLVAISLYLRRRAFLVFGALGCYGYVGHLAYSVFRDSVAFPFALSGVGLLLILITVWVQRTYPRLAGLVPAAPVARADRRIWG